MMIKKMIKKMIKFRLRMGISSKMESMNPIQMNKYNIIYNLF